MARVWRPVKLHYCQDCGKVAEFSLTVIKAGDSRGAQYYCSEHKEIWEAKYQADYKESRGRKQKSVGRNWSSVGMVGMEDRNNPYQRVVPQSVWAGRIRRFFK